MGVAGCIALGTSARVRRSTVTYWAGDHPELDLSEQLARTQPPCSPPRPGGGSGSCPWLHPRSATANPRQSLCGGAFPSDFTVNPKSKTYPSLMAGPINMVVDKIPLPEEVNCLQVYGEVLYTAGGPIKRIDLRNKTVSMIAPNEASAVLTLVDFHRPIDLPPDVAGAGAPDRRIYVPLLRNRIGEITPALFDQFTAIEVLNPDLIAIFPFALVGAKSAKFLYLADTNRYAVDIVDLGIGRMVGSIQLSAPAFDIVISPDDRFLYTAHTFNNLVSVIDTHASPPQVTEFPVLNGPSGLALMCSGHASCPRDDAGHSPCRPVLQQLWHSWPHGSRCRRRVYAAFRLPACSCSL